MKPLLPLLLLASLTPAAHAQGSDTCSTPTPITGPGTFAVSTVGSTDSPQQTGSCPTIHHDVWFAWTATSTASMNLQTCSLTTADTVVAVYPTTACPSPGTQLACNDDACSQQSSLYFNATAGSQYLIQIGAWSTTQTFTANFSIQPGANPCGTTTGPDVITGDITSLSNYVSSNGLDAFTLGTTSCNIGTTFVNWNGPTAFHPVMGETFYKYKVVNGAGRFEMIGIGWLKHGFAADTGSLCCTCQNPFDSQKLGVGCSDPYSSGQAGAQAGLAPRWQVNAHTGVFPYPGANPPWSGTTARRTEVALADLEPTAGTTRYFAECNYTTQDDAQAGNGNNNSSYKELLVTGGPTDFVFATSGPVQRMQQGLRAWQVVEPAVTLTDVQVPGDGLFIVGSHATSLGGGVYRYEYAVHNMNANRACGSFSVPVPAGASITNIGFHDITYRNGDGVNNVDQTSTDWPGVVSGGAITWSSETMAQNLNANAIRWSATYNFRFDANIAPQNGLVTFGLWKPGLPAAMSAAGEVPGAPPITAFCLGDGTGTACPCANTGTAGNGCANSGFASGAHLAGAGTPSVLGDTVVLSASSMTGATCVFFQGDAQMAPVAVDDGLGCVTGSVVRLGTKAISGAGSSFPQAGDPLISVRGAIPGAGGTYSYQCFYRNAVAAFCPPATSNRTNGVQIVWAP